MSSSQFPTVIVAIVLAIIAYFLTSTEVVTLTPTVAAAIALISAFISPFFIKGPVTQSESSEVTTLYVGNLPYRANEGAVRALFSDYGKVHSVRLMKDKQTGKRRGFGFVEISASDAQKVITKLNDSEFQQRTLKVREAKERPEPSED